MAYIIFKSVSSDDMPVKILDLFFPSKAERQTETISIPGRSKTLVKLKEQYKNIIGKVVFEIKKGADVRVIFDWLSGSGQLITSDEPEKYLSALSAKPVTSKRINGIYRSITILFECEPFAYSTTGTAVEIGTTYTEVNNFGTIYAEPLIEIKVTAADASVLKGDVNFDGKVDPVDASLILNEYQTVATGGESTLTDAQKAAADMNNDGNVDVVDATLVLQQYAAGTQTNPNAPAKQIIIYVNGEELIIGVPSAVVLNGYTVTVDSELQLIYYTNSDGNKINIMQDSYGDLPLLHTGMNYAKYSGDVDSVTISVRERWV